MRFEDDDDHEFQEIDYETSSDISRALDYIFDLHQPGSNEATCDECRRNWPCDTVRAVSLTSRNHARRTANSSTSEKIRLGHLLRRQEQYFKKFGHEGEEITQRLHELVITSGLKVRPSLENPHEFEVCYRTSNGSPRILWSMWLAASPVIKIVSNFDSALGKKFLATMLLDSYSTADADDILEWWARDSKQQRTVICELSDSPKELVSCIRVLCDASNRVAIEQGSFDVNIDDESY